MGPLVVLEVPLPAASQSPASDASSIFFGSFRLPWPGPTFPGARGLPFSVEVPQVLLAAPPDGGVIRSFEPSQSAAHPSAGGRPLEVTVVACSFSTAASVALTSIDSSPIASPSPSVACSLLLTLVTGPPMPLLPSMTASFAHLLWFSSVSIDSCIVASLPSLRVLHPALNRGYSRNPTCLPLPPVSPALPHLPCVGTFSPTLCSDPASTATPSSSPPPPARLPGPTTGPSVSPLLPDRLPPVSPLLNAELGISLPDALASLKVTLPQEQLDFLRSSFVAIVAPASHSNLTRLRR
ncbi:uncharacterized protein LOC116256605 [Nymphaea colorata]|uniref:uncharacterized protein LOC116256605 n=1 Tax=Nymphaea colorata TaxID=210225 RepID=UPI00129D6473|nr:uncharacterized protein LOC116256605 [Nymphaea colorata]